MDGMEIEIKVRLNDTPDVSVQERKAREVEELLTESGFDRESEVYHRDLYLSHPGRDFSKTDEALRIRTVKDILDGRPRVYITYKGPKLSERSKARVEREVRVQNLEETREIFYSLGFRKVLIVEKHRKTYTLDDMVACLDMVPDLGCFLEMEVMDTDIERGESRLLELLKEWDMDTFERRSYLELLLERYKL